MICVHHWLGMAISNACPGNGWAAKRNFACLPCFTPLPLTTLSFENFTTVSVDPLEQTSAGKPHSHPLVRMPCRHVVAHVACHTALRGSIGLWVKCLSKPKQSMATELSQKLKTFTFAVCCCTCPHCRQLCCWSIETGFVNAFGICMPCQ